MSDPKDENYYKRILAKVHDFPVKHFIFETDLTKDALIHRFLHNRSDKRLDHSLTDIKFVALSFRASDHVMIKYRTGWDFEGIDEKDDIRDYHTDSEYDEGTQLIHRILLRAPGQGMYEWTPTRAKYIIDLVCDIFGVEDLNKSDNPKIQLRW